MAITKRADAIWVLKVKMEERKLLRLKAGPGRFWLFKRPLDAKIRCGGFFLAWKMTLSCSLWPEC
jgi:hypothetical protein